ncbi:MAG: rRNA adenine N-6-methyltransferase family protein [Dermatophilaceae bacterium]
MDDGNADLPAADHRLEQYFLTSPSKVALLIDAAAIAPGDRVVELGAGAGTVARHVPSFAPLTLVELDARLADRLREHFPQATVLTDDALAVIHDLPCEVLLSNLPGDVTRRLLHHCDGLQFRTAIVAVDDSFTGNDLTAGLVVDQVATLNEDDFHPRQPAKSRLLRLTRR